MSSQASEIYCIDACQNAAKFVEKGYVRFAVKVVPARTRQRSGSKKIAKEQKSHPKLFDWF